MTAGPLASRSAVRPAAARPVRNETAAGRIMPPMLPPVASEDDFRVNLGDLPRKPVDLEVDGFAPSLFSRLLDLIERLRGRT